jgi:hypothetical protein
MYKINPIMKNEFLRTPAVVDIHEFPNNDFKD